MYLVIASLIPRYLDYQRVSAPQFSSSIEYFRARAVSDAVRRVETRRRRTRYFDTITSENVSFDANILDLNAIVKYNARRIISDTRNTTVYFVKRESNRKIETSQCNYSLTSVNA